MKKKNKKNKTYDLRIDEEQISCLIEALDLYSRLFMGQTKIVGEFFKRERSKEINYNLYGKIDDLLNDLKFLAFPEIDHPNASHGVNSNNISDKSRMSYDLIQVLRHRIAWDNSSKNSDNYGVNFQEPMRTSDHSLPTIKRVDDEEN